MRFAHSCQFSVSLVGQVVADPEPRVVGDVEVSAFSLTVPRQPEDLDAGTFPVHVVTPGPPAREVAERLVEGCCVRVSGTLDVGECPTPGGDRQWGLRLVADEIAVEEIDVA